MKRSTALVLSLGLLSAPAFAGPISDTFRGRTVKCGKTVFEFSNNALKAKVNGAFQDVVYDSAGINATIGKNILEWEDNLTVLNEKDDCKVVR